MSDVTQERRGRVSILTINRERSYNALNRGVLEGLRDGVAAAARDPETRAVVITGSGRKAFCAGADLNELRGTGPDEAADALQFGQRVFRDIEQAEVPVITAVNGLALGGGFELVLASTFPILSTDASLGLPESSLGLIPGYGGTQRLPRSVGRAVASHLMLTGSRLEAERAYQLGLTPLMPVDPESLLDTALECAVKIAAQGPRAVRSILASTVRGSDASLDAGLQMESGLAALAVAGHESAEGIDAFLTKRTAMFSDYPNCDEGGKND